jgi:hypothetical protein
MLIAIDAVRVSRRAAENLGEGRCSEIVLANQIDTILRLLHVCNGSVRDDC